MLKNFLVFHLNRTQLCNFDFTTKGIFKLVVRWRKPPWAPISVSKLWHVPERRTDDPVEKAERIILYNNYRTAMKALRNHLKEELEKKEAVSISTEVIEESEKEFQNLLALNDEWNRKTKIVRESRLYKEVLKNEERRLQLLIKEEQVKATKKEIAHKILDHDLSKFTGFITPENLDEEIEKALDKVYNYNFYVDLQGNFYHEIQDKLASKVEETFISPQIFELNVESDQLEVSSSN